MGFPDDQFVRIGLHRTYPQRKSSSSLNFINSWAKFPCEINGLQAGCPPNGGCMPTNRGSDAHQTGAVCPPNGGSSQSTHCPLDLTSRGQGRLQGMQSTTLSQRTNHAGFPKPGELIEITGGSHQLEASDRAILNILYQHAHDSGRLPEPGAEWELPLTHLRFTASHKGSERVRDSLDRLMRIVVTVPFLQEGEERILKTHLLDFVDLSANEASTRATVRFGIPKKLQPILLNSSRWGRIKAEIVCAMTSKYAIALYELIQLRSHMDRCIETFPIERFRELVGVPPLAYRGRRAHQLLEKVISPALLEVNGLSDMGVGINVNRQSPRAPIHSVSVSWWQKDGEEFRKALKERDRSKIGRMARLSGKTETITQMQN
jgi:hypothetical protein